MNRFGDDGVAGEGGGIDMDAGAACGGSAECAVRTLDSVSAICAAAGRSGGCDHGGDNRQACPGGEGHDGHDGLERTGGATEGGGDGRREGGTLPPGLDAAAG